MAIASREVAVAARSGDPRDEDQQRHGDDASSDPEEGGEEPRREPDGDEAHGRIVRAWSAGSASSRCCSQLPESLFRALPHARRRPAPRCSSSSTTRGSARARSVAATGSSLANGVRTRCGNGQRQARCYVARAVDRYGRPYVNEIPEGALVRGAIELGQRFGDRTPRSARASYAVYAPAGTAAVSGGYYRVVDNGIAASVLPASRIRAGQVNGSSRVTISEVDLAGVGRDRQAAIERAQVGTTNEGRSLRPRPVRDDPGRRPRVPRAAALPQSAAASRLRTSQASRTSSSVVRKLPTARRSW